MRRLLVIVIALVLFAAAWRAYAWPGVAAVAGGLLMWLLLHFTRLMTVMKRAADRPVGWVASAVMLNAKLKPGVNLMHVIAMTRSLGERLSTEGEEPERFRWTDNGGSMVTVTLQGGKVTAWELFRPTAPD